MTDERFMYVGPTITGVAARNTVYDGMPGPLAAAVEAAPYLSNLCLPISAVAAAMKQIARRQGSVYTLYQKALEESATIQADVQKGEE